MQRVGVEKWREGLVDFGTDQGQPFLQLVALIGAVGRSQLLVGYQVGDVLHDGRAFMQALAIV
jgi:hypothetical protein